MAGPSEPVIQTSRITSWYGYQEIHAASHPAACRREGLRLEPACLFDSLDWHVLQHLSYSGINATRPGAETCQFLLAGYLLNFMQADAAWASNRPALSIDFRGGSGNLRAAPGTAVLPQSPPPASPSTNSAHVWLQRSGRAACLATSPRRVSPRWGPYSEPIDARISSWLPSGPSQSSWATTPATTSVCPRTDHVRACRGPPTCPAMAVPDTPSSEALAARRARRQGRTVRQHPSWCQSRTGASRGRCF